MKKSRKIIIHIRLTVVFLDQSQRLLKENFLNIDHVGVGWAAEFLLGEDADGEDLQAEVVGFMTRFVDTVSRK